MFVSAYLLEYALSFDTVIVISLQCQLYRIPRQHQPRVMFWGLVGGILVRLVIVTGAACLASAFTWTFYLFGALVAISALGVLKPDGGEEMKASDSLSSVGQRKHMRLARILWRRGRLTDRDDSGRFWAMKEGRRVVTMAAACVLAIVLTEVVFALDSSVAIMSVSRTTFIVVTSSILASIALRSWFSMVGTIENLRAPRKALAALLVLIGVKLFAQNRLYVPHAVLLVAIVVLIGAALAEILLASRRARTR